MVTEKRYHSNVAPVVSIALAIILVAVFTVAFAEDEEFWTPPDWSVVQSGDEGTGCYSFRFQGYVHKDCFTTFEEAFDLMLLVRMMQEVPPSQKKIWIDVLVSPSYD